MSDIVHLAAFVLAQIVNQFVNRLEQRIERIFVAVHQHPGGERAPALLVKGIESQVDHVARAPLARAGGQHGIFDRGANGHRQMPRQFLLKACGRAEMMEQIGMGAPDARRHGFERDRLGAKFDQQRTRGFKRDCAAFFLAEAFPY